MPIRLVGSDMGHSWRYGPVLVDGEPTLVVDATAAALQGHGVDARAGQEDDAPAARSLLLLVPVGAEALCRALDVVGRHRLPWGAIVDGRADARGAATVDALGEAGASWVLDADAGLPTVLDALAALTASAAPADPARTGAPVLRRAVTTSPARRLASLTTEERAVLEAMAGGRSLGETAHAIGSTVATVRAHRRAVRVKLGVRSQLAAVALLIRQQAEDGPYRGRATSGPAASVRPGAPVPHLA
ncbi:helix-turn-helix transcriptional regulator [Nocardioides sp. AX2bis]|uniref:helix-turn-helix transcriptional regulator n=1 Tax=Nocardioides sp. AX2bis TaxID=2653157 RepID=UPI0012F2A0E5|nr:helix-turn-helix transcriptional regulator [Nocardioides sp. AX2bis]VXC06737.1 putative Two component transcriptional regulator, LuxR family [Nocardioides sp. AX2bis]